MFTYQSAAPKVEDATGALTQHVAFEIPPGRNGLTPDLALLYNSQNLEDGLAGYGWSFSIPYIERMNKTGSEHIYVDNYFSSSWGGELASTSVANAYRHRTEDGRFIYYTFAGNSWVAYDKEGTTYTFGATSSAQLSATTSPSNVYRWMLEEIRDTNDNYIRYEYEKDDNQIYPSKIVYTGHGTTGGIFEVVFTYENRPDPVTSYKSGFRVVTSKRVDEIQATINDSWVRKYTLAYTSGINGARSLLSGVQETGRDKALNQLTLPPLTFEYSSSSAAYTSHTNPRVWSAAHAVADDNGNGLPDKHIFYLSICGDQATARASETNTYPTFSNSTACPSIADGDYWAQSSGWDSGYGPVERGLRMVDVSGDGKADVLRGFKQNIIGGFNYIAKYYENQGSVDSLVEHMIATTSIPMFAYETNGAIYSTGLLGNVNGDGLTDYVLSLPIGSFATSTHLHQGTSTAMWATTALFTPIAEMPTTYATQQADQLVDINGDGLDDWMHAGGTIAFCLNTGTQWDASCSSPWNIATSSRHVNGWDRGIRFIDINGDGLPDYVRSYDMPSYTNKTSVTADNEIGSFNYVYVNTGSGFATSSLTVPGTITTGYLNMDDRWGGRVAYDELVDWNGDGILDNAANTSTTTATAKPDLLTRITYPTGGNTQVAYKLSAELGTNPDLAFPVLVVAAITDNDGMGNAAVTTYAYEGGRMYLAGGVRDRRFAGFRTITKTDPLAIARTYFHQGNDAETGAGEQNDSYAQIGRPYREDIISLASTTMQQKFSRWTTIDHGDHDRKYVYRESEMAQHWDGDGDHRDLATEYTYATTTGDLTHVVQKGEVSGSSDGTYADTGSDTVSKVIVYAASSTSMLSVPMQETVTNHAGAKVQETKFYYDTLGAGAVTKGNLTKREEWKAGSLYASSTRAYNSHGLVTAETDARGNTTAHTFDEFDLYIATTTNPLNQTVSYTYDYATGRLAQVTDGNERTREFVYDPVGRLKETKVPDPMSGSLVTQSAIAYIDNVFPRKQQETRYLTSATSTEIARYVDGLGRIVQERRESSTNYATRDWIYGNHGLLWKESLPYFSSGSEWTAASSNPNLLATYGYDALRRLTSIQNSEGAEALAYDQWTQTATDREGKMKDFARDAFGNLAQVSEHYATTTYSTTYAYDAINNLTKITDALGNVRNFLYDGLARLMHFEDLHAPSDDSYGSTSYTYDDAGNVISRTDAKGQVVNWTYDDLNRVVTEDYTGSGGTEVAYEYDTCSDGVARLCVATTSDAVTTLAYNPYGLPSAEAKTIDGVTHATSYVYDRQGNVTAITYPDASAVRYAFDSAGVLAEVARKPANSSLYVNALSDLEYSPTGAIAYKRYGNGVASSYTYDANQLYRLTQLLTSSPGEWGGGGSLGLLEVPHYAAVPRARIQHALPQFLVLQALFNDELPFADAGTSTVLMDAPTSNEDEAAEDVRVAATTTAASSTSSTTTEGATSSAPVVEELAEAASDASTDEDTPDLAGATTTSPALEIPDGPATIVSKAGTSTASTTAVTALGDAVGISGLMEGKSAQERADIKGQKIERALVVGEYESELYNLRIELLRAEAIPGGIQVLARAWKGESQLGFGADGSVEIERFRIFNPPILVDDPSGEIVREWTDLDDQRRERRLREDPVAAIRQSLAHIVAVVGKEGAKIVEGKVGNTTSTFYPAGGTSAPVDGVVGREGASESFATLRGAAGTVNYDTSSQRGIQIRNAASSPNFSQLHRAIAGFDTSAIADTDIISSATFSLNSYGKHNGLASYSLVVDRMVPANSADLANSDHDVANWDGAEQSTARITYAAWNSSGYNDFTLNSTGLGNISKTGHSWLGLRLSHDFDNASPGYVGSGGNNNVGLYWADWSGTSNDPKLIVEHTAPNSAPTAPTSLEAEGQTNPADITDSTPEFSALYNDPNTGDAAVFYALQVASAPEFSSTHWDSGKVAMATTSQGNRSPEISYGGPGLASSTPYYWRIKFWDDEDAEGAWSTATSSFSLASPGGGGGGSALQNILYAYDNAGNITQLTDLSDTGAAKAVTFGHDDLHRLTSASTTAASSTPFLRTYAYSALGNLVDKSDLGSYTYGGTGYANPHAPTLVAGVTHTYDNNGNLIAAGDWTYTWDYRNRLASAGNGFATTTYGYDHADQRVRKVTSSATTTYPSKYFEVANASTGATTTAYVFAGSDLVATIAGDGTATTTGYIHSDHLGSTNVVTDENGDVVQVLDYYPFGAKRISTGQNTTDRHFIGERYDSSTELNYLNARYYRSAQGQFLSQDATFLGLGDPARLQSTVGVTQGFVLRDPQLQNSYSYGRSNPITMKDPQGNIPAALIPFILFGAGAALDAGVTYYADVMGNRAQGNANPYTDNLSSPAAYGVGSIGGGISMSTLGVGRVAGGVVAGVNSLAQDWAGGETLDYGKAAIVTGGTTIAGTAFKGLVGASPFAKVGTRGLSQSAVTQGLRYETSQGLLQSGVNAIGVSNYQTRNYNTQNFNQSSGGGGGSLSSVLSSLSRALSSLSKALNSLKK